MKQKQVKLVIGRREKVDFPTLKLCDMDAKVDTGAYTSAIHCDSVRAVRKDGRRYVRFRLLDPSHPAYDEKEIRKPLLARRRIKNSFGQTEFRYIIKTKISLFGQDHDIELSLSDRSKMEYPILLGRKFLHKKFVVDVSRFNLSKKKKIIQIERDSIPRAQNADVAHKKKAALKKNKAV
ncbi:MAG: RimK/LysX family protein [Deltaproteobacteria bacterium]